MSDTEFTLAAGKPTIDKDPNAELDYNVRFTKWLDLVGDTISLAPGDAPVITTVGVTLLSSAIVGGKVVVLWLGGGTVGQPASATVRIKTVAGRIDDRTVYFKVKQR
jgi:hypothetical protein